MIAGGNSTKLIGTENWGQSLSTVEVLMEDLETIKLSNLPIENYLSTMSLSNGTILLCGGSGGLREMRKCIQLDRGTWKDHSTLNRTRTSHSAVATQTATFLFGGIDFDIYLREAVYGFDPALKSLKSYEYLPNNSNTWLMGKNEIPRGFEDGFAIASKCGKKIWLIGGIATEKRILSFNVQDHTFQELPSQLNVERREPRCAFIPSTNKIMITGGCTTPDWFSDSTEIFDADDESVTMANPMNVKRAGHGLGTVTINGEDRLAVFGGASGRFTFVDSVELYNTKTLQWETTTIRLKEPKSLFAFLEVKLEDILTMI